MSAGDCLPAFLVLIEEEFTHDPYYRRHPIPRRSDFTRRLSDRPGTSPRRREDLRRPCRRRRLLCQPRIHRRVAPRMRRDLRQGRHPARYPRPTNRHALSALGQEPSRAGQQRTHGLRRKRCPRYRHSRRKGRPEDHHDRIDSGRQLGSAQDLGGRQGENGGPAAREFVWTRWPSSYLAVLALR